MYDALVREYAGGNKEAVELDEVREWSIRSLETISKALFSIKSKRGADFSDKKTKDDAINLLFYLKERITSIEQRIMSANPFRSLSPKSRDMNTIGGKSIGTTSAASGRDNPFNQVVHVNGEMSHCESAARKKSSDNYYNSVKDNHSRAGDTLPAGDEYRTFDQRKRSSGKGSATR